MSSIDVAVSLTQLFCYHGADEDGDSEPYLWTIMFVIDGSTITQSANRLSGSPRYFTNAGSHGNLGSSISTGALLRIPAQAGRWQTTLQPILINDPRNGTTVEVPGVIGVLAILMEENDTPDEDVEAGHQAIDNLVKSQLQQFIDGIDLVAIAAQVQAAMTGQGLSQTDATIQVLRNAMQPVIRNLQSFAEPVAFEAIVKSLGLGGAILSAISKDQFQGSLFHSFDQTSLAATSSNGNVNGMHAIAFTDFLADPDQPVGASWAYNVHGAAWQTSDIWWTPIPQGVPPGRWQVTGINKALSRTMGVWISEIGGTLPDGSAWLLSRSEAVDLINKGANSFFVVGADGSHSEVIVSDALHVGHDYLTTTPDASKADNLLSLPQCAISIRHQRSTA
jgi:hypothetical protein